MYEKKNNHECKIVHTAQQSLHQQKQRQIGKENKTQNGCEEQAHEYGYVCSHAAQENKQNDDMAGFHRDLSPNTVECRPFIPDSLSDADRLCPGK